VIEDTETQHNVESTKYVEVGGHEICKDGLDVR
jgi:hypothetical protein